MKYFFLAFAVLVVLVVVVAGPRGRHGPQRPLEFFPDMVRQSKVKPQSPARFFADNVSGRRPVSGTVPMGFVPPSTTAQSHLADHAAGAVEEHLSYGFTAGPDYLDTGMMGDQWGTGIPVPVTAELLARGQNRFQINCQVCHGGVGLGNGVTSKYGLANIANYHLPKYRDMADGEIYYTITNGHNSMNGYGANLSVSDRWAIVCYIRTLQKTQNAKLEDLPPEEQQALAQAK